MRLGKYAFHVLVLESQRHPPPRRSARSARAQTSARADFDHLLMILAVPESWRRPRRRSAARRVPRNRISCVGIAFHTTITTLPSGRRKLRFSLPLGNWTEPRYCAPLEHGGSGPPWQQQFSRHAVVTHQAVLVVERPGNEDRVRRRAPWPPRSSARTPWPARSRSSEPPWVGSSGRGGGSIVTQRNRELSRGRDTNFSNCATVNVGSGESCSKSQVASPGAWFAPSHAQGSPSFTCWPKRNSRSRTSAIRFAQIRKPDETRVLVAAQLPVSQPHREPRHDRVERRQPKRLIEREQVGDRRVVAPFAARDRKPPAAGR